MRERSDRALAIRILGDVSVEGVAQGRRQLRLLAAILALQLGRYVSASAITALVWQTASPADPAKALHIAMSRLRSAVKGVEVEVVGSIDGYALVCDPEIVDVARFERLVGAGGDAAAVGQLGEALDLWSRGGVADDLSELSHHPRVIELEDRHVDAAVRWSQLALDGGSAQIVANRLAPICARHPYREDVWAWSIRALTEADRSAEARQQYVRVVERLSSELGAVPGDALNELGRELGVSADGTTTLARHRSMADEITSAVRAGSRQAPGGYSSNRQVSTTPARVRVKLELGRALRAEGDHRHREVLLAALHMARETGDVDLELEVAAALRPVGWLGNLAPDDVEYCDQLRRSLSRADESDSTWRAVVAADLAGGLMHAPGETEHVEMFDRAVRRARRLDDDGVMRRVLANTLALDRRDRLDDRVTLADELLERASSAGDHESSHLAGTTLAMAAIERGDQLLLDRAVLAVRDADTALDQPVARWGTLAVEATLALRAGQLDDAGALAERALAVGVGTGITESRALGVYGGQLFELRRLQGRNDGLLDVFDRLAATQPDFPLWRAGALLMEAVAHPSSATADRLRAFVADRIPFDHGVGWSAEAAASIEAALVLGLPRLAAEVVECCEPFGDRWVFSGSATSGPLALLFGRVALATGDSTTAKRWLEEAHAACENSGAPVYRSIAALHLANLVPPERARSLLRGAEEDALRAGAELVVSDVRVAIGSLGLTSS